MTKDEAKQIHGKLEVKAVRDSRMGNSDTVIPAGSIGYASYAGSHSPDRSVVFWPFSAREHKGDWRTGVHDKSDLQPTGRRGHKDDYKKDFAFK